MQIKLSFLNICIYFLGVYGFRKNALMDLRKVLRVCGVEEKMLISVLVDCRAFVWAGMNVNVWFPSNIGLMEGCVMSLQGRSEFGKVCEIKLRVNAGKSKILRRSRYVNASRMHVRVVRL